MESNTVQEKLEQSLDSQGLNYSLDVDMYDENITVALSYEGDSFPTVGSELDDLLEEEYEIAMGENKPEENLANVRSRTFTLKPVNCD